MTTVGETLAGALEARGVSVVFGILGVHTVELHRGVAASSLRHVTARHEQGAGFMADGYARVAGRTGVVLVITGPGLTNALTAMGQARADSVPMLVICAVNARGTCGAGLGLLHELPDQLALGATVALDAREIGSATELADALDEALATSRNLRPGPWLVQIPVDVARRSVQVPARLPRAANRSHAVGTDIRGDADTCRAADFWSIAGSARRRVPVCGGGARLMDGTAPPLTFARLVRVDVCARQLERYPAELALHVDATRAMHAWLSHPCAAAVPAEGVGAQTAALTRAAAWAELEGPMRHAVRMLELIRDGVPDAIVVGDSTQPVYAGNLYHDHDRPGGWFNSATGFGTLGYAVPAAIGASIAAPRATVACLVGDGGAQFSLAELMSARDERVGVIFIVWNNRGYLEIELSMRRAGVGVVGRSPSPPRFEDIARACDLPWFGCAATPQALSETLKLGLASVGMADGRPVGPFVIELNADEAGTTTEEADDER